MDNEGSTEILLHRSRMPPTLLKTCISRDQWVHGKISGPWGRNKTPKAMDKIQDSGQGQKGNIWEVLGKNGHLTSIYTEVNFHVGWVELEICTLINSHVINVPANLIHCGHIPGTALSSSSSASHKKLEHLSTVVNLMPCHTIVWLFFKNLLIVPWLFSFTSICSSARSRFDWWGHIILVSTLRKWVLFWAILAMHGLWYF